ncbi:MAG: NAD(P)H-hydrate dehydratase, partial [Acidimicrobiales bacterium]
VAARRMVLATDRPASAGRWVLVIAGKGNNGADGRAAARHLERWGLRCRIVDPPARGTEPGPVPAAPGGGGWALVVDAAYGTGMRGAYRSPTVADRVPVLAVDIPSGVDGLTGRVAGAALAADRTVTFAAAKPGLLLDPGRRLAGRVEVVDIGLDCSRATRWWLEATDLDRWPARAPDSHKWRSAVRIVGGRPGMLGAPSLAAAGAARAGAGYVTLSVPGVDHGGWPVPTEAVLAPVGVAWADDVIGDAGRHGAVVLGPGLAVDPATRVEVRRVVAAVTDRPLVLDGGALDAVADDPAVLTARAAAGGVLPVLTPHDGELARLLGRRTGTDRIAEAGAAAARLGAVVLSKGPTTVAAHPDGRILVSTAGDRRLATAGTGDVLAGVVGAALAAGLEPFLAAGLAAERHGRAALRGRPTGFVASDLPALLAAPGAVPGR